MGSLTWMRQSKPPPTVNLDTGIYLRTNHIRAFFIRAYLFSSHIHSLSPSTAFTRSQLPSPLGGGVTSPGHWLSLCIYLPDLHDVPHIWHLSPSRLFTFFFLASLPPLETTPFWEPPFWSLLPEQRSTVDEQQNHSVLVIHPLTHALPVICCQSASTV